MEAILVSIFLIENSPSELNHSREVNGGTVLHKAKEEIHEPEKKKVKLVTKKH